MLAVELVGVVSGILAIILLYRNNILTWPVGFLNIICFVFLFYTEKLIGDLVVQFIFLGVGIYGWVNWNRKSDQLPSQLGIKTNILIAFLTLAMLPLTVKLLNLYFVCSYPLPEAIILNLSITGQILTSKHKLESWLYWIVADILMSIVYGLKGLELTMIYAIIGTVLGFMGYFNWKSLIRNKMQ